MLDAEARGNGTVDARAEVRAPAATAGYTQRRRGRVLDTTARYERAVARGQRWWRRTALPPPRVRSRPSDQRSAERRPGDSGSDRQGTDRQEGRAHHQPHRAARTLPGLHADRESHRRVAQDFFRGRAPAPEAHHPERARERAWRIHRPHRRPKRERRRTARRHPFPEGLVEGDQESRRELEAARADLSRSQRGGARAARPGHLRFHRDLGRYRAGVRAHSALLQSLPAGAGQAGQALHQRDAAVRAVRPATRKSTRRSSRKSG